MFLRVPTTQSPYAKRPPVTGTAPFKAFWARPAYPELNRSGDWLLRNLTTTRARSKPRAGPA